MLAWNIVDIFFAIIVASLPALNGVLETGVSKMKAWGSTFSSALIKIIRGKASFKHTGVDSMQLSDKRSRATDRENYNIGRKERKSRTRSSLFDESNLGREADVDSLYCEEYLGR